MRLDAAKGFFPGRELVGAKLRASGIHLGLSLGIFAVLMYLILFRWYPGPWFAIDGGWTGVRIMVFVDLVLGPFLTLMVFNPAKTRLALGIDFTCIGLVQASALVWGIQMVHFQRPQAIVFWDDGFFSVDQVVLDDAGAKSEDLRQFGKRSPVIVAAREPRTDAEREKFEQLHRKGLDGYMQPWMYEPLGNDLNKVFAQEIDVREAGSRDAAFKSGVEKFLAAQGTGEFHFVRFYGRYQWATLALTPDGRIVASLPFVAKPPKGPQGKASG
jgi:hypothetical protein